MRLDPATFETIFHIFIGLILLFFAFAAIRILSIKARIDNPPPRPRPPAPGGTGEYRKGSATHATFGTSGIGSSDLSPAGMPTPLTGETSAGDSYADASWDSSDSGGDSGGGDYSGGGGDSGGGGSSGSWS